MQTSGNTNTSLSFRLSSDFLVSSAH